jgi:hypothetical protein
MSTARAKLTTLIERQVEQRAEQLAAARVEALTLQRLEALKAEHQLA